MSNADTPLHELDRQERLRELEARWVDAFLELCATPPTDTQGFVRHIEKLNAIEALEAETRHGGMDMTLDDVAAVCRAAKLAPLSITLDGGDVATVEVSPLTVVPQTAIKRLYAAGVRQVNYGWNHERGDYFRLRMK